MLIKKRLLSKKKQNCKVSRHIQIVNSPDLKFTNLQNRSFIGNNLKYIEMNLSPIKTTNRQEEKETRYHQQNLFQNLFLNKKRQKTRYYTNSFAQVYKSLLFNPVLASLERIRLRKV